MDPTAITIHDPFKRAYECLKGVIQANHGLDLIVGLANDQTRAIEKLKHKHFMITKNQTKKGKKHTLAPKRVASRKTQRQHNLFELKTVTYNDVTPLADTWREYMKELVYENQDSWKQKNKEPSQSEYLRILRASYHMAPLTVLRKGCEDFTGIVLKETLQTFYMITAENAHRTVIKA